MTDQKKASTVRYRITFEALPQGNDENTAPPDMRALFKMIPTKSGYELEFDTDDIYIAINQNGVPFAAYDIGHPSGCPELAAHIDRGWWTVAE